MTTQELEEKIEGAAETPSVEFKECHNWDVRWLAKDILALSNVLGGGFIIIGIEDETFQRQGITAQEKATYKIDIMRDQMTKYADPHVNFTVEFPKDRNGLEYAVIRVLQFEELPVICRISDEKAGVREATIYYRNTNRRVESAPVSNSYDLRMIIMAATAHMMGRMREMRFVVEDEAKSKLDQELNGL